MTIEFGEVNRYDQASTFPAVDLIFTGPKKSLVDRVSGKSLQFTRNTIGTYVDANGIIQTAAAGEPRYTYDPLTGEELGLMVEEERTNLLRYSQDLSEYAPVGGPWWYNLTTDPAPTFFQTYFDFNTTQVSPDGASTAPFVSLGDRGKITQSVNLGSTQTITLSFWARRHPSYSGGSCNAYIAQTANDGLYDFAPLVRSDRWTRISYTRTMPAGTTTVGIYRLGNLGIYEGLYVWGFQLEAGSFPTSYIPTTTSTVTRDPDTVTLTNNNLYNNSQFDIVNDPFGMSAGSDTLTLLPSNSAKSAIKRATIFSPNIAQTKINTFAKKTDEFWRWRVKGTSFGLPQFSTNGQVTVDWGDGTIETLTTSDHTFTNGGGYHDIGFRLDSGTGMNILINDNVTHKDKVVAIGPAPENMVVNPFVGFKGCTNLTAFDPTLNLIEFNPVQSATQAWLNCSQLKSFPKINSSSITNFGGTWQGCSSLTSFPLIDTSSGTDFNSAWNGCSNLTSFPLLDTSSATNLYYAWRYCSGLTSFPQINTSNVTNFGIAWDGCSGLTSFPLIDTSSGTSFYLSWQNCSSLTSFPLIDTSNATTLSYAWRLCRNLTSFPQINTSNCTDFSYAWDGCYNLTEFPLLDTSNATTLYISWRLCRNLTSFPQINTPNVAEFSYAWNSCINLTSFPVLDTSSATKFQVTWSGCTSLTDFPAGFFDTWGNSPTWPGPSDYCFDGAWQNTTALTSTSVENILNGISGAPGTYTLPSSYGNTDIDIAYNASSGTPDITVAAIDLTAKGWVPTLNGSAKTDPYSDEFVTLDLDFATNKTLVDNVSGDDLITFTRNSTATYVDNNGVIQTAAVDTPRFDHDPLTNESLGLLVEEARTNNIVSSAFQTFSYPYDYFLITPQVSLVNNRGVAPDGTFTASLYEQISACVNNQSRVGINPSLNGNFDSNSQYYFSYFVKLQEPSTTNKVGFSFSTANFSYTSATTAGYLGVKFIFSNDGEITSVETPYSDPNSLYKKYANGWYRISIPIYTGSVQTNVAGVNISIGDEFNLSPSTYGKFLIWGACIEKGNFTTSYIPSLPTFTSRNSTATYYDANGVIQTAGVNVGRDDAYLPDENGTFYPAGLLLEDAATNGVVISNTWGGALPHEPGGPNTGVINDGKYKKIGVTHNYGIAPDGTLTSLKLGDIGQHAINGIAVDISIYGVNEPSATINTFSTFVRKIGNTDTFTINSHTGMSSNITFTFSTETFTIGYAPWYILGSEGYQKLANGWYRIWFSYDLTQGPYVASSLWSKIQSADPTFELEIWGAQKNAGLGVSSYVPSIEDFTSRSSTATYYDANGIIQTAAIDVARDDAHLPDENDVFRPIGTLIESSSINYTTNSENASVWGGIGGQTTNVSNDVVDAPDGNATADLIYGASGNWTALSILSGNTILSNVHYIIASVFVKKVPGSKYGFINLNLSAVGSGDPRINLNLDTGETITYSGVSGYAEKLPNGWYRLVCKVRNTSGAAETWTANSIRIFATTSSTDQQGVGTGTGSTTDGVYVWGRQVETNSLSSLPTSYIPTAGSTVARSSDVNNATYGSRAADVSSSSTVTRAADVAQITGSNFSSWYSPENKGTVHMEGDKIFSQGGGARGLLTIGDSYAGDNNFRLRVISSNDRFSISAKGLSNNISFETRHTPETSPSRYKMTVGFDDLGHSSSYTDENLFNTLSTTYTSLPFSSSVIRLLFNNDAYIGTHRIARLTYWPKRLTDTSLQYLTQ